MTDLTTKTDAELDAEIAERLAEQERRKMPSEEAFGLLADVLEAWGYPASAKDISDYILKGLTLTEWDTEAARVLQAALDAARGEQPTQADGWIEWHGGECPVPEKTEVQTILRHETKDDFEPGSCSAGSYGDAWHNNGLPYDIIAYRVVKP